MTRSSGTTSTCCGSRFIQHSWRAPTACLDIPFSSRACCRLPPAWQALFVFAKIAHRLIPATAARFAILLYTVDFVLVRYQRYGLAESVQILLLLSVVAVWLRPGGGARLLRGPVLAAAILQKPTSVYIVPVLLWFDWQAALGVARSDAVHMHMHKTTSHRPAARWLVPYLAAAVAVGVVHGALWIAWPRQFLDAWRIYVGQSLQFSDMLRTAGILFIGSPIAVLGALVLPFRLRRAADREHSLPLRVACARSAVPRRSSGPSGALLLDADPTGAPGRRPAARSFASGDRAIPASKRNGAGPRTGFERRSAHPSSSVPRRPS